MRLRFPERVDEESVGGVIVTAGSSLFIGGGGGGDGDGGGGASRSAGCLSGITSAVLSRSRLSSACSSSLYPISPRLRGKGPACGRDSVSATSIAVEVVGTEVGSGATGDGSLDAIELTGPSRLNK